jgi:hypothetical protein
LQPPERRECLKPAPEAANPRDADGPPTQAFTETSEEEELAVPGAAQILQFEDVRQVLTPNSSKIHPEFIAIPEYTALVDVAGLRNTGSSVSSAPRKEVEKEYSSRPGERGEIAWPLL